MERPKSLRERKWPQERRLLQEPQWPQEQLPAEWQLARGRRSCRLASG